MEYSPFATVLVIFAATYLIWVEIIIALIAFFISNKSTQKRIIKTIILLFPLAYLLQFIASLLWNNPRPFVVGNFEPLVSHTTDNGFPSDHTLVSSALAGITFLHKKSLGLLFILFAIIIGIGRIYAGVHHPIDIIGALIIAFCTTIFISWLQHRNLNE